MCFHKMWLVFTECGHCFKIKNILNLIANFFSIMYSKLCYVKIVYKKLINMSNWCYSHSNKPNMSFVVVGFVVVVLQPTQMKFKQ